MSTPTPHQDADTEFNHGSFDSAAFAAATLANARAALGISKLFSPNTNRFSNMRLW